MPARSVCVGAIAGAYGVAGEVRLKSFCTRPEAIAEYGPLTSEDGARRFEITALRPAKDGLVARLDGVRDRDAAAALRGTRLHVAREYLPELPDDEFYHADLIGLAVRDGAGAVLGRIRAVMDHGAGDLLEIAPPGGGEPVSLPFTRETVPTVDLAAGVVIADPPPGLFE